MDKKKKHVDPVKERKKSIIIMAIGATVVLVATAGMLIANQQQPFVKDITPEDAYQILFNTTKGKAIAIDIRAQEDYEFQGNFSINGSFRCPLNTSKLEEWGNYMNSEFYKDQTYVIYCARGNEQALTAANKLSELGFEKVYYLTGGFLRWKLENYSYVGGQ